MILERNVLEEKCGDVLLINDRAPLHHCDNMSDAPDIRQAAVALLLTTDLNRNNSSFQLTLPSVQTSQVMKLPALFICFLALLSVTCPAAADPCTAAGVILRNMHAARASHTSS
jgi:hypothetical protein